jgi:iron complex outermembrane receptor protein
LSGSVSAVALLTVAGMAQAQQAPVEQTAQAVPADQSAITEVTVTGYRHSLEEALTTKRQADGVVESVNAEDIGRLPDKNVADALQRLPGITTIQSADAGAGSFGENDRVEIRGTAPSLTQTLIDGHTVGTGDWFILDQLNSSSRSVSYSMFPSEMVDHIVVYKSSQADLPEGGSAGSVDIITRSPLGFADLLTVQATGGASLDDLRGELGPQFNGLIAWKNDDHTFGVEVQGFYEDKYFRRDGQEELGYAQIPTAAPFPKALQGAYYPAIINDALFEQERLRQGGDFAVEFRPDKTWDFKLDGFYSYLNASNYNQGDLVTPNQLIGNGIVPTAYTVQNGVLTSAVFPPGKTAGGLNVAEPGINDIYRPDAGSSTYYIDFDATWHPVSNISVHTQVGYTRGKGSTDQWALGTTGSTPTGLSYALNGTNPLGLGFPGGTAINNPSNYTTTGGNANQDWVGDDNFAQLDTEGFGQIDAEYAFDSGIIQSIKAGVRVAEHIRNEVEAEAWAGAYSVPLPLAPVANGYFPSDFGSGAGFSAPFNISVDPNAMVSEIQSYVAKYAGGPGTALGRFYYPAAFYIKEDDDSGYVMARIGGDNWSGNFGVRVASTNEAMTTYDTNPENPSIRPVVTSLFGNFYENPHTNDYMDILPSMSFKYDLTPQWVVHASASQTMSRPDYYALAGGITLNDQLLTGQGGNPSLKPTRSSNFDVSTEWYYDKDSALTFGLFDMQMQSTWDTNTTQQRELNLSLTQNPLTNPLGLANPIYSTYNIVVPVNNSGQSKGFELSWQQPLYAGFGVNANFTFAQSSQNTPTAGLGGRQLLGASKDTGNVTVYYQNDWIDSHLSYSVHSQIYEGLDGRGDKYFQDVGGELDGVVNLTAIDNLTLSVVGLNLADEVASYVNQRNLPLANYDFGRTFYFTATYKFTVPDTPAVAAPVAVPMPTPAPAAPPPAPMTEAARSFQVFFDFDKSDITAAAAKVIQAAADAVKAGHVVQITVTGHTDTVGSASYNQGLSERRAAAVKTGLVADGVSGGEITTIGVGKTGLLVPTADGVREPQNRRAEIVLQ